MLGDETCLSILADTAKDAQDNHSVC